jgi:DNA-binding response OmpR family regulator
MMPRRPKVLVVDDEDDIAFLIHHVLHQYNDRFDVLLAKSVEIALEILAETPVEVIITDVQLPDRSGMDLLSWAAIERPDTRVIIMTAFDVDRIKARAHAFGCLRLLRKPFDVQEMRNTVLQALDRRDGFGGTLSELSCVDVLQMLCIARKTTAVRFSEDTSSGAVYIDQGEIVHAVWNDLSGEEAFYGMMAVARGVFHTAPFPVDVERTLSGQWQYLLMEGTRRLDEAVRDRPSGEVPVASGPQPTGGPYGRSTMGSWPGKAPAPYLPPASGQKVEVPRLIDEGFAHLRAGRRDDAKKSWEEALRLEPSNRMIELNLRKLNGAAAARPALGSSPRGER